MLWSVPKELLCHLRLLNGCGACSEKEMVHVLATDKSSMRFMGHPVPCCSSVMYWHWISMEKRKKRGMLREMVFVLLDGMD